MSLAEWVKKIENENVDYIAVKRNQFSAGCLRVMVGEFHKACSIDLDSGRSSGDKKDIGG